HLRRRGRVPEREQQGVRRRRERRRGGVPRRRAETAVPRRQRRTRRINRQPRPTWRVHAQRRIAATKRNRAGVGRQRRIRRGHRIVTGQQRRRTRTDRRGRQRVRERPPGVLHAARRRA